MVVANPANTNATIFTSTWYEGNQTLKDNEKINAQNWDVIFEVRQQALKVLEEAREKGIIGSGLDAEVKIYCEDKTKKTLLLLEDELRFVLITSDAEVDDINNASSNAQTFELANKETIKIEIRKSDHNKCVRCWHLREDVGKHDQHPELCSRCIENIEGTGEVRQYA